jgi:hypothetical protein
MNRALLAVVMALGMMGCAAGEDDPVPGPVDPGVQRDPPAQTLAGQLQSPVGMQLGNIEENNGYGNVPVKQSPPGPDPMPFAEQR